MFLLRREDALQLPAKGRNVACLTGKLKVSYSRLMETCVPLCTALGAKGRTFLLVQTLWKAVLSLGF